MKRLLSLALLAVPIAACGSNSPGTQKAATADSGQALQFARCMRAHGVPNFPDPTGGHLDLQVRQTPGSTNVNGVEVNGPAFQAAMQTCHRYLPNGGQPRGPVSAAVRTAALQFAHCMRSHGVPSFPDPRFQGGGVTESLHAGSGIEPNSPAFKTAQQTCQPLIRRALGGGPKPVGAAGP
jgi:hypothetical protein